MARHWKLEDDGFLVAYFDSVGDYIGVHDLGRPKGAATRRVADLKKSGAWDALVRMQQVHNRANIASLRAELEYARAVGWDVEPSVAFDDEAEAPADIYDGGFPWRRDPFGEEAEAAQCADIETHQEILSALKEVTRLLSDIGRGDRINTAIMNARKAIARAEGRI